MNKKVTRKLHFELDTLHKPYLGDKLWPPNLWFTTQNNSAGPDTLPEGEKHYSHTLSINFHFLTVAHGRLSITLRKYKSPL